MIEDEEKSFDCAIVGFDGFMENWHNKFGSVEPVGIDEHVIRERESKLGCYFPNDYFDFIKLIGDTPTHTEICAGFKEMEESQVDHANCIEEAVADGLSPDWPVGTELFVPIYECDAYCAGSIGLRDEKMRDQPYKVFVYETNKYTRIGAAANIWSFMARHFIPAQ